MNKLLIHMMNAGDIDHRILPGLQKMQKAGQVRRFTMPAIQQDFSSNDNLANPIAVRKRMEADFITKRNIDKRNALQAAQDRQGYIRQAGAPRSAASKAWAIMTNPMTALKYKVQGRDIPDNFERGEKNSLDLAANIVNPFFYINEGKEFLKGVGNIGYKAVTDPFSLSGMDFLNTAMHGVGALPAVGEAVQGANLVSKGLRGATKAYKGTAGMTSKLGRVKNAANAGAIELGYTPGDITGHSYFNIPADEVSKMMSQEMGSLPKGAFTFDGNMSKNSAPLFWTQAARSPKGFTVVNPGTTQGLNWSGTMGKRVSNALPKNIEKIMPDAANYAEELKNRIDYLKKLGDPKSLQNAAQLERDGISSQIVSDLPNAAMTDYNVKNSFTDFLNSYKTTLDNPIIEVNRKTGLNFPMTKILDENIGKWTNNFYEQPSIYMVKGNPLSRVPKLIGDYTKTRANNFYFGDTYANPRMPFIKANTLYNTPNYIGNQSDYEMGGSYDQPCYECGGAVKRYDVGGYYDCPDQEKDPVTGKCAADVARGKEANAANKAASKDMNAWAKQAASMDKEIAKQNAAQTAGQLTFDYDWMGSPVDKSEKKAAMGQYKQFFQQNPNTFIADDTSGYSPEQKYIIASKLKQRMSTPMGAKLVQQQFGVDPRFYDLQRLQTEMAPKMGGWNGMRNWLFNVYKEEGGPIVDPRGQWAHPGKVTRIPSSNITMEGVPYPVLGVASSGQQVMMQPGQNYNFGDAEYVDEYPMMKNGGGLLSKSVTCSNCGWSWKAVDGGSDPLSCHKCGGTVKMQAGGQPDYNSILDQNAADAEKYPSAYHKDFVTGYPVANSAGSIPRPGGFDCPPGYTKYRNPDGTFSCIMTNSAPGSSKVDFSRMTKVADDMQFSRPMRPLLASIPIRKNGGLINMQGGGQSSMDSVRHQANKILQYEQLRGGPGGAPLPQYSNPKYMDMLMGKVYPEVRKIMPNASAMEAGEAMDFVFNAGFDQGTNKITKDPRAFALQEYYRQNDPSKLDADGKWAGRKNAPYSFDQEYNNTIGKLPENQRRILMNKGRDWYYKNINNPAPGVPNSNYNDTWFGRIWNTNDYQPFNPNNPNFTPKKEQGGEASLWDMIKMAQGGEMIRRADGSYSRRGLWDNIRANKGSGKKPTKQMLEQERKIKSKNK
jgi:hypothetical protein